MQDIITFQGLNICSSLSSLSHRNAGVIVLSALFDIAVAIAKLFANSFAVFVALTVVTALLFAFALTFTLVVTVVVAAVVSVAVWEKVFRSRQLGSGWV